MKVVLHHGLELKRGLVVSVANLEAEPVAVGEFDPVVGPTEPPGYRGNVRDDARRRRRRHHQRRHANGSPAGRIIMVEIMR